MQKTSLHRHQNRHIVRTVLACVLLVLPAAHAHAQAQAAPRAVNTGTTLERVTDFKSQPLAILTKFPKAGPAMASFVAALAVKNPEVIDALLSIVEVSTPEQASALGAGLVRASRVHGKKNPGLVKSIAAKVEQSKNFWLKSTYNALGIRYNVNAPYTALPLIPPTQSKNLLVTTGATVVRSRIGPNAIQKLIPMQTLDTRRLVRPNRFRVDQSGTLVAIINSGAFENGAVSTSPTN